MKTSFLFPPSSKGQEGGGEKKKSFGTENNKPTFNYVLLNSYSSRLTLQEKVQYVR